MGRMQPNPAMSGASGGLLSSSASAHAAGLLLPGRACMAPAAPWKTRQPTKPEPGGLRQASPGGAGRQSLI